MTALPDGTYEAEKEIRRLIQEIAHCTDRGDYAGWVAAFIEDGRHVRGDVVHAGRAELLEHIASDQPPELRGIHVTSNIQVDIQNDKAQGVTDFLFIAPTAQGIGIIAYGEYRDDFRVDGSGRWKVSQREVVVQSPPNQTGWPVTRG
jgi:hypothetical protein